MYLIVGLGNPEEDYAKTRHNMGFEVLNELSKKYDIKITKTKFKGLYGLGTIEEKKVILLKPQTYMNLSGESIIEFVNFYKIPLENVIVIYDDIDTDIEKIKIRKKGGPGTHNGMKSVVEYLKTEEFKRVRIGIGSPKEKFDLISYVIGHISEDEYKKLQIGVEKGAKAVVEILKNGIDIAMNKYN